MSDYDTVRSSWDFPSFAKDFPRDDELDALVIAFARGDYAAVREQAPVLAKKTEDAAVRAAAEKLGEAIRPDPSSRLLVGFAAALLVFLTVWWVTHDGPGPERAPTPAPTVERPK